MVCDAFPLHVQHQLDGYQRGGQRAAQVVPLAPKFSEWRMVLLGGSQRADWYSEGGEKKSSEYEASKEGGDVAKSTSTQRIPGAVGRSFIVALGTTFLNLLIGSYAGYAMARYQHFWFADASLNLLMITRMLLGLALLIPFFMVYRVMGLLNTLPGLIIAYTSFILPLTVWVMRGYFTSVPKSLEWSAQVDGCNWFQVFWRIFLPVSAPGLIAAAIFTFLVPWNEFLFALILVPRADVQTAPLAIAGLITPGANVRMTIRPCMWRARWRYCPRCSSPSSSSAI